MPRRTAAALAALAVATSVLPLLFGFAQGHDWLYELVRIAEFRHALQEGQLPPYRAPNLYGGFGSPIFVFYAPLFAATAAGLSTLTGSIASGGSAALILFSVAGALLVWRLVSEVRPGAPGQAAIAVVLFALHPYLLGDKWARNANAEFVALSILPAVLLGAVTRDRRRAFLWTSLSIAAVVLAHNITALVAVAMAIGMALFVHRPFRDAFPFFGGLGAGLALSAFFWIPAVALQPLIRTEELLRGKFDFHGQFPPFASLFGWRAFYSGGALTAALLLFVAFAPVNDPYARRVVRACAIASAVFLLFMLPLAVPLWESLPLLKLVQFPWRFMGPLAVVVTVGAGIAASPGRSVRNAVVAALLLASVNAAPMFLRYRPVPVIPLLTPQLIREENLRATVLDEYLPRDPNALREEPWLRSMGKAISASAVAALLGSELLRHRRARPVD